MPSPGESNTPQPRGSVHAVSIVSEPIAIQAVLESVAGPDAGAVAVFAGTVRETNQGRRVLFLEYEAYRPMAERVLREIAEALPSEFGPCRAAIVHRIGRLEIGETSVAIAIASPHRRVALQACAAAIERLKATAPIWKKEHFEGGAVWIEGAPQGGSI